MLKYKTTRQETSIDSKSAAPKRQCSFVSSQIGSSKASVIFKNVSFPLAWPSDEYFDNRGEWREFKVVLILRSDDGQEITSDPLEKVNRTISDLRFNQTFIFNNLSPEFSIEATLCAQRTDADAGPNIVQSVSRSLGRRFGMSLKRYMSSSNTINSKFFIDDEEPKELAQDESRFFRHLTPIGRTIFRLKNASLSGLIRVYRLQTDWPELLDRTVPKSALLPIFGNICCQIFVQPASLVQPLAQGNLDVYFIDDRLLLQKLSCVLQGGFLKCYNPNGTTMSHSSSVNIPIDENTIVDMTGFQTALKIILHDPKLDCHKRLMVIASSQGSFLGWKEAIKLQIMDCKIWKEFASFKHNAMSLKSMAGLNLSLKNSISRYAKQFGTLPVVAMDTRKFLQEQGFDLPMYRRSRRPLSTIFSNQNNQNESNETHSFKKPRPDSDILPNTYVINLKIGLDEPDDEMMRKISSTKQPIPIELECESSKKNSTSSSSTNRSTQTKVIEMEADFSDLKIMNEKIDNEYFSTLPRTSRTKVHPPPPVPPKPSINIYYNLSKSYKPPVPPRKLLLQQRNIIVTRL